VTCDQSVADPSLVKPSIMLLATMIPPAGRLLVAVSLRDEAHAIQLAGEVLPDLSRPASAIGRPDTLRIDIVG
jgi:hypothetical protein